MISYVKKLVKNVDINVHSTELFNLYTYFANGPGDWGSIPGRVIPKTQKMVFNTTLVSTQLYKVRVKGKVAQLGEWSSALPYTSI